MAAGGLALAAGVLGLVRLTGDPGGAAGFGTAEADPRPDPVTGTDPDRPANVGATVAATPTVPSTMGGESATPAPAVSLVPGTPGTPTSVALTPGATYTPAARTPAPAGTAAPRATASRTPTPVPLTSTEPAPEPQQPGRPSRPRQTDVCVPVVGLCVETLDSPRLPAPKT